MAFLWPACNQENENFQFRVLHYIFNNFNSIWGELQAKAERPLLYIERVRGIVTQVFRLYSNIHDNLTPLHMT